MARMVSSHGMGQFRFPASSSVVSQSGASVLPVGAGGFVRGLDMNPDGTMIGFTDTAGAWLYDPSAANPGNAGGSGAWRQLITVQSLPSGDAAQSVINRQNFGLGYYGCYEARSAPSNSSIIYAGFLGYLYKSTNKGGNFVNLNASFTPAVLSDMNPNDGTLTINNSGPKLAIDPINPSIVYFALMSGSAWFTLDGGSSWTQFGTGTLPACTSGKFTGLAYDRRVSTQSGGKSTTLYAFPYGTGCYVSTNAGNSGTTFTKISGTGTSLTTLTTMRHMIVDSQGNLWVTEDSNNNIYKWNGSSWALQNTSGVVGQMNQTWAIAEDPTVANAQRIVISDAQSVLIQTANGGTSWSGGAYNGGGGGSIVATDIPWIQSSSGSDTSMNTSGYVMGDMAFIPGTSELVIATGVGFFRGTPPTSFTSSNWNQWTDFSTPVENLTSHTIIAPPNGKPIGNSADRAFIQVQDNSRYAIATQPADFAVFPGGNSVDWASSNPLTIVGLQSYGPVFVSSNGGTSWTTKTSSPSGSSSQCIAAASSTAFVLMAGNGNLAYTNDGATTWNDLGTYFNTNFGVPTNSMLLQTNGQLVCADRVASNTFYAVVQLVNASGGGIYRSTNGGAAWSQMSQWGGANKLPTTYPQFGTPGGNSFIRSVYNRSGHLIFCGGQTYQGSHPYTTDSNCYLSTDGGVTWNDLSSNLRDVWGIDTGPTIGSYPRIYAWGWVNVASVWTPGVWYSDDQGSTWTKLCEQYFWGSVDLPTWIEASKTVPNLIYVSWGGSGFARYRP